MVALGFVGRPKIALRSLVAAGACLLLVSVALVHWNDSSALPAGWEALKAHAGRFGATAAGPGSGGQQDILTEAERSEYVVNLRGLLVTMPERWPPGRFYEARQTTLDRIRHLANCLEADSCSPAESRVIIGGSMHFGNSQSGGNSGEDIWARSTVDAFHELGHTLFMGYEMLETLDLYQAIPKLVSTVIVDALHIFDCTYYGVPRRFPVWDFGTTVRNMTDDEQERFGIVDVELGGDWRWGIRYMPGEEIERGGGCIRREGYEQGIPLYKTFSWAFWANAAHPLGNNWTLAPEDYATHPCQQGNSGNNFYLGYSIEKYCKGYADRPEQRLHRAYFLAKDMDYLNAENFPWDTPNKTLFAELGEKHGIAFVAGAGSPSEVSQQAGITNIGKLPQSRFWDEVALSRLVVGVGRPNLSPTPYDALCLGVPFLHPLNRWDADHPDDNSHWCGQHDGLLELGPPYVYHVHQFDTIRFEKAVVDAMSDTIEPFIPPRMTAESNLKRHVDLLTRNWEAQALPIIAAIQDQEYLAGVY